MIHRVTAGARYYAGIGSRETPEEVQGLMTEIAGRLGALGYTLRSGAAEGADTAFYLGAAQHDYTLYTPWRGFVKNRKLDSECVPVDSLPCFEQAMAVAEKYHPRWDKCSLGAQKLHARNALQVLGTDLATPSDFVVAWTKTGGAYGGTGEAIRIAQGHGIRVYNLKLGEHVEQLFEAVGAAERGEHG